MEVSQVMPLDQQKQYCWKYPKFPNEKLTVKLVHVTLNYVKFTKFNSLCLQKILVQYSVTFNNLLSNLHFFFIPNQHFFKLSFYTQIMQTYLKHYNNLFTLKLKTLKVSFTSNNICIILFTVFRKAGMLPLIILLIF